MASAPAIGGGDVSEPLESAGEELGAERCRACLGRNTIEVLDLGTQAIANRYVDASKRHEPEPAFPLIAYVCLDCALIQLPNRVPAEFFRHYLYTPAAAEGLRRHFSSLADRLCEAGAVAGDGYLVDIGCNEGVLLRACVERGIRVVGVDPARNLIERVRADGIEVVGEYFDVDVARRLARRRGPASAVTTTNTFNHIPDLHDFVGGVRELLRGDGVFVVEVPHSGDLVEHNEFDTIYHEHLSEFSLRSIVELCRSCGLEVFDVEALSVHGGSMRVWAQLAGGPRAQNERVAHQLEGEAERGLYERSTYEAFRKRVESLLERLRDEVADLKRSGATVAAYGSPAKGMTLLAACGFGPDEIDWVADRSTLKQGRYTPGTGIPIVAPRRISEDSPDVMLMLAWNYLGEIVEQQSDYLRRGGRFLVPIPTVRFIDADTGGA